MHPGFTEAGARVALLLRAEAGLAHDLVESGCLDDTPTAREEWRALAVHAGLRALVAVGGFNPATAEAIDDLHRELLSVWSRDDGTLASSSRAELLSRRHDEYGRIAQNATAAGAGEVPRLLGHACLKHAMGGSAKEEDARMVGESHQMLVDILSAEWGRAAHHDH